MSLLKSLLKLGLAVIGFIFIFGYSTILGWAAVALLLLYMVYKSKGSLIYISASKKAAAKDYEGAMRVLRYGYEKGWLAPVHQTAYGFLLLKRFGEAEKAEKVTRQVIGTPKLTEAEKNSAKLNMALIHYSMGEKEKALEEVIELYEEYKTTNLYATYGYFLIDSGDLEKALELNLEAYDYNKDDNVILDNLGQIYILTGEYEKAQEIYNILIPKRPSFPEAYYNYGVLKEKQGDMDEAIFQMKTALQKEYNYLTTIDGEMIKRHIEKLYEKKDTEKEAEAHG